LSDDKAKTGYLRWLSLTFFVPNRVLIHYIFLGFSSLALDTCASVLMVRCFCDKWCESFPSAFPGPFHLTRDLIKLKTQSVWSVASCQVISCHARGF